MLSVLGLGALRVVTVRGRRAASHSPLDEVDVRHIRLDVFPACLDVVEREVLADERCVEMLAQSLADRVVQHFEHRNRPPQARSAAEVAGRVSPGGRGPCRARLLRPVHARSVSKK